MIPELIFAKNVFLSNCGELTLPYRLTYILTYRCNLQCGMCNIWKKNRTGEMTVSQIDRFFAKSNKFSWVNLSGGEIFLREDLMDIVGSIVRHCKNLYLLDFPTNGFKPKLVVDSVKKILAMGKKFKLYVTVSLDGPPQLHDRIRNMQGAWEKAIETFRHLAELRSGRLKVFFGMTFQAANAESFFNTLTAVKEKIKNISPGDFHVNIVHLSGHYYDNVRGGVPLANEQLRHSLSDFRKRRRFFWFDPADYLECRYLQSADVYLVKNKTPMICQALGASFFMDPAGNVYPCTIYDKPLGNIADYNYDIYQLWQSAQRRDLRQGIRNGNCPQCWTPCEAYQSILANLLPKFQRGGK